jgi:Mor family transcriptional regulator
VISIKQIKFVFKMSKISIENLPKNPEIENMRRGQLAYVADEIRKEDDLDTRLGKTLFFMQRLNDKSSFFDYMDGIYESNVKQKDIEKLEEKADYMLIKRGEKGKDTICHPDAENILFPELAMIVGKAFERATDNREQTAIHMKKFLENIKSGERSNKYLDIITELKRGKLGVRKAYEIMKNTIMEDNHNHFSDKIKSLIFPSSDQLELTSMIGDENKGRLVDDINANLARMGSNKYVTLGLLAAAAPHVISLVAQGNYGVIADNFGETLAKGQKHPGEGKEPAIKAIDPKIDVSDPSKHIYSKHLYN